MKNENCTCGHKWDMHQGYGILECLTIGCACQEFEETQQNSSVLTGEELERTGQRYGMSFDEAVSDTQEGHVITYHCQQRVPPPEPKSPSPFYHDVPKFKKRNHNVR